MAMEKISVDFREILSVEQEMIFNMFCVLYFFTDGVKLCNTKWAANIQSRFIEETSKV